MKINQLFIYIGLLGILVCITFTQGCDESADDLPILENLTLDSVNSGGECCDTIFMSFDDQGTASNYYWIGLERNGNLVLIGKDSLMTPPFFKAPLFIEVSHFDALEAGDYELYVYVSKRRSDIGVLGAHLAWVGPEYVTIRAIGEGYEEAYCCTGNTHKYAQINFPLDDVMAVGCSLSTNYGFVCGEGYPGPESAIWAYSSVAKEVGNKMYWAQMGYARYRPEDYEFVFNTYYAEIEGAGGIYRYYSFVWPNGYPHPDDPPFPPGQYTTNNYWCELDDFTGVWSFEFNDTLLVDTALPTYDNIWQTPGKMTSFCGEIVHNESDMPGTQNLPCKFRNLVCMVGGNYLPIAASPIDPESSDYSEWNVECDSVSSVIEEIRIWDRNPVGIKTLNK